MHVVEVAGGPAGVQVIALIDAMIVKRRVEGAVQSFAES
jgi:hypothetical protein